MKKTFYLSLVLLSVFCSCQKRPAENDVRKANLTVSIAATGETRATGAFDADEATVNSFQVYCFDKSSGVLETSASATGHSCSLSATTGLKSIHVLANAPSFMPGNLKEFLSGESSLKDNALDGFVMVNRSDGADFNITGDCDIDVTVRRMVAKILVDRIVANFTEPSLRTQDFVIDSIFIANASKDCSLDMSASPSGYYYGGDDNGSVVNALIRDKARSNNLKNSGTYDVKHGFYVYPNKSASRTMLVIKATLLGAKQTYSWQFPDILANNVYEVQSVTITRPSGTLTDNEVKIAVSPWENVYPQVFATESE